MRPAVDIIEASRNQHGGHVVAGSRNHWYGALDIQLPTYFLRQLANNRRCWSNIGKKTPR